MTNRLLKRRSVFALAAVLGTVGTAKARRRKAGASGKDVMAIPADNPVFGKSVKAFERYGYSPAVAAGGLLFIAGVVGARTDGSIADTVEEQAELIFTRISEILRLAGLSTSDLVEITSYHVGVSSTLPALTRAKDRHLSGPLPAWNIIGVESLASPSLKLEVRSVAAMRKRGAT